MYIKGVCLPLWNGFFILSPSDMWRWVSSGNTNKGGNSTRLYPLALRGLFDHRRICKRKTKTISKSCKSNRLQSYVPREIPTLKYLHELITKISEFLITKELSYLVVVTGGAELGVGIGNPKSSRSWSEISRTGSSHSDKLEKFSALKN